MPTRDSNNSTWESPTRRRSWFRGALTFVLIVSCFAAGVVIWPRTFQSEAKMYFRLGRESVRLDATATTGQMVSLAETREREILSALELLRTRALFEQVVDELGVDSILHEPRAMGYGGITDWSHLWPGIEQWLSQNVGQWMRQGVGQWLPQKETGDSSASNFEDQNIANSRIRESAVLRLMKSVSSSLPKNSNVIVVQCTAASPKVAQQRLACLLRHYQEQHLRLHRTTGSFAFFEAQVKEKKGELDEKLAELRDAKNHIGVASVDGEKELLSLEATAITQHLLEAQAAAAAATARLDSLLAELSQAGQSRDLQAASSMSREALDMMRARLFDLEIEHQRLHSVYEPTDPKTKAISEQVAIVKTLLKRQEAIVERSNQLEQQKRIAAAQTQRAEVGAKLCDLNKQELQISGLERQSKFLEDEYRKAVENREQARLDDELTKSQISNINLAQPPTFAAKPVSPNVMWNLCLGLTAALLGAVAVTLRGKLRHNSLEVDVKANNGPMVATHPKRVERPVELQV